MAKHVKFSKGMEVEARREESGLEGFWYPATVLRVVPKQHRVSIEYDSLMSESNQLKKLKAMVKLSNVRPRPPVETQMVFQCGDAVDAFYNDGWLEGMVKESVGDSMFVMYFSRRKEEMQFEMSRLRHSGDWIGGKWVPKVGEVVSFLNLVCLLRTEFYKKKRMERVSEKLDPSWMSWENLWASIAQIFQCLQTLELYPQIAGKGKVLKGTSEMKFPNGMLVEVCSDEEGFTGAWFVASIVNSFGENSFEVEYKDLKTDDETELLRETLDSKHIRPTPPIPNVKNFQLLEEVDAWYNDAWWVGVISKILEGPKYIVYFRTTKEEIEFQHSELRFHQEWLGPGFLWRSNVEDPNPLPCFLEAEEQYQCDPIADIMNGKPVTALKNLSWIHIRIFANGIGSDHGKSALNLTLLAIELQKATKVEKGKGHSGCAMLHPSC
ncbi:hypothetical protein ACLOJK_017500 [Asimina triloba]